MTSREDLIKEFQLPEFQRTLRSMGFVVDGSSTNGTGTSSPNGAGAAGGHGSGSGHGQGNGDSDEAAAIASEEATLAEFEQILRDHPEDWHAYDTNEPTVVPRILNVVATVDLKTVLDQKKIHEKVPNVELDTGSFASCIIRTKEPRATCVVFTSGKLIIHGTKRVDDCKLAAKKFVGLIRRAGYDFKDKSLGFRVTNITAKVKLPWPMRLNDLMTIDPNLQKEMSYEPELFPGLIWESKFPKCKAAIFANGDVLYTGLTKESDLAEVHKTVFVFGRLLGN